EFPFVVMMSADLDASELQPVRMLDARLDPVEDLTLAFIEGQASHTDLLVAIRDAASAIERDLESALAGQETQGLIVPRDDHDAVGFSGAGGAPGERAPAAYSWQAAKDNKHRANLCLWWHEGSDERPADFCVTRGMPPRGSAAAFFLGDWEAHGWARHD